MVGCTTKARIVTHFGCLAQEVLVMTPRKIWP